MGLSAPAVLAGEDAARIELTDDAVITLLRDQFSSSGEVAMFPHVPPQKERAARRAHGGHLCADERILALYDPNFSGGGVDALIITSRRLCWRDTKGSLSAIEWRDLDPDQLDAGCGELLVGEDAIPVPDEQVLDAWVKTCHILALSGLPRRPVMSGFVTSARAAESEEEEPQARAG